MIAPNWPQYGFVVTVQALALGQYSTFEGLDRLGQAVYFAVVLRDSGQGVRI